MNINDTLRELTEALTDIRESLREAQAFVCGGAIVHDDAAATAIDNGLQSVVGAMLLVKSLEEI